MQSAGGVAVAAAPVATAAAPVLIRAEILAARVITSSGRAGIAAPVTATLDLELGVYIKRTIFNFEKHRRVEHYRLITERIGAKVEV